MGKLFYSLTNAFKLLAYGFNYLAYSFVPELFHEKLWQAGVRVDGPGTAAAAQHSCLGRGDVGQHGVAVATVAGNRLGNRLQLRDTALSKRLNARRRCNHLVNGHVQGSKELGVKLLGQDVLGQARFKVLAPHLGVLLGISQDFVDHIVQRIEDLGRHVQALQFLCKLSHSLRVNLGSAC